ncbi:MAG: hypothetical protein K6T85_00790 [Gorillibacterium sp.]|nr:hypothetical protein [Gorillibacterium sp.]
MDFMLHGVTWILQNMGTVLGGFSWSHNLAADIQLLQTYYQKANIILPVDAALQIGSLFITVQLALAAYYWICRVINLIRGAG